MQTRFTRVDGNGDVREDRDLEKGAAGASATGGGHEPAVAKKRLRWLRNWVAHHKGEILWGLFFAWVMARFIFPPPHDPYFVRVLEYTGSKDTEDRFKELATEWNTKPPMLGDVPVQLEVVPLTNPDTDPSPDSDRQEVEAQQKATEISDEPNTLMVIGHLPTGFTKRSLPMFMGKEPPIPYIATTASADNLCEKCAKSGFLPWLQLSPRNRNEASSMVLFASQRAKQRCVVVTDQNPVASEYSNELGADLASLDGTYGVRILDTYKMGSGVPPSEHDLQIGEPDCVLYAGHRGTAEMLWNLLRIGQSPIVIFSDGVIESRGKDATLDSFLSSLAFFTYATDAAEAKNSLYSDDAVGVARQVIEDLNNRGGNISYRLKALVHFEDVRSARANLFRVMAENSKNRTWYQCRSSPSPFCIFAGNQRENGLFHIWQLTPGGKFEMKDIDGWHQPKSPTK